MDMDIVINTNELIHIIGNDKFQCFYFQICFPIYDYFCKVVTMNTARVYRLKVALLLTNFHSMLFFLNF